MAPRTALALSAMAAAVLTVPLAAAAPAQAACSVSYSVSDNNRAVVVRNSCGESRRVTIIWNNATDSACTQLKAYTGEFIDSRGWPAAFDRLTSC